MPDPPLAANEPLPKPLELEKIQSTAPLPIALDSSAPSTSSSCAVADDPEVAIVEKVEKIPSNGNYSIKHPM